MGYGRFHHPIKTSKPISTFPSFIPDSRIFPTYFYFPQTKTFRIVPLFESILEMLESKFFESLKRRKILCFLLFFPKIIESIHLSNSRMNRKKPRTNWSVEFFFLHDSRSIESVTDGDHRVAGSRESVIKLHTKVALIELAADFVPFEKFRFSRGIRRFLRVVCEINFTTFVF